MREGAEAGHHPRLPHWKVVGSRRREPHQDCDTRPLSASMCREGDSAEHLQDPQRRKKLAREQKILSRVQHPHIVRLFRTLVTEQDAFLFHDIADEGDLFSLIRDFG